MKIAYVVSEREHWVSAVGGLLGLLAVVWVCHIYLGAYAGGLVVASMGASAVLLFAAPHGAMSQPWAVFGGHLVSAIAGVTAARWLADSDPLLAAAMGVGMAIFAMYALRCLHPPGGATALYAVMGGDAIHALGYSYVFNPVLLNVAVLLAVAIAYNYPFAWRRYPQIWHRKTAGAAPDPAHPEVEEKAMIPHSDLVYALSQLDTFIDVSEEDLQRIYALALGHHVAADEAALQTATPAGETA